MLLPLSTPTTQQWLPALAVFVQGDRHDASYDLMLLALALRGLGLLTADKAWTQTLQHGGIVPIACIRQHGAQKGRRWCMQCCLCWTCSGRTCIPSRS